MPTELVTVALSLVDNLLEHLNIKAKRKYLDMWFQNEQEIRKERAKWPNSDDPKLESLYDKRQDIIKAAQTELQMATAK
jgi:hypothetical protein